MAIKSTKTLGYNLTGILDLENGLIIEIDDEGDVVHDLEELLRPFDEQEIRMSFSHKVKLEDGVE